MKHIDLDRDAGTGLQIPRSGPAIVTLTTVLPRLAAPALAKHLVDSLGVTPAAWLMVAREGAQRPGDVDYIGYFGSLAAGRTLVQLGLQNHRHALEVEVLQGGPVRLSDGTTWNSGTIATLPNDPSAMPTLSWSSSTYPTILRVWIETPSPSSESEPTPPEFVLLTDPVNCPDTTMPSTVN